MTQLDTQQRNTYLTDIPMADATEHLHSALAAVGKLSALPGESVPVNKALGRVTAEPIWAARSAPHYHASAMDGYVVKAADTVTATETRPTILELGEEAYPVNTGAPIPPGYNAVIMIEHVQHPDDDHIEIIAPTAPWQHVRMMGEDMVATELVLPANHTIRPVDLGAIAGCGHATVNVRRRPHVVLIPTGSELVSPADDPEPGQIIEYNSMVLSGQIEQAGGQATVTPITPDDQTALIDQLQNALSQQPDLVLVLSGSSAGSKDFTAAIVRHVGQLLVHGIAVRPGHPVIMGMANDTPIIGVPGYPVSAALTGELFITPLIKRWLGLPDQHNTPPQLTARITRKLLSPTGDDDYVRVTVANVADQYLATPVGKGAGVITSLVRADGIAHIPRFSEGLDMGDKVTVKLYRPRREIDQAVLIMGSHDPMLDLLAQHVAAHSGVRLVSANVGSLGGLVALRRGEAHLAGAHLLDEDTGDYNITYVERQLRGRALSLVTFAHREQGFIVPKGNPQNITAITDLSRVSYINRQRGAGTRLLLDYELKQNNIDPAAVVGYDREEYTHMAVAAAIATGTADCGLGVRSAAIALDMDFVSVGWERFDLIIPSEHEDNPSIQAVLETLNSNTFRDALSAKPGYRADETGTIQHTQAESIEENA
ncbi:MAG: molybdopterin biosynthesis protein [Chloroflexota bacterium]